MGKKKKEMRFFLYICLKSSKGVKMCFFKHRDFMDVTSFLKYDSMKNDQESETRVLSFPRQTLFVWAAPRCL